jgi:hypothetical protein
MPDRSDSTSDPPDRGLAAAFGPGPAACGVLETLAHSIGPVSRVLLRDTDGGSEGPLVNPAAPKMRTRARFRRGRPLQPYRRHHPRQSGPLPRTETDHVVP